MSLTLNQLQDRQNYINASEIAWVVKTFDDSNKVPFMPAYCRDKTKYQFYCEKIATQEQLQVMQEFMQNEAMQQGNLREEELANKHLSKYFEISRPEQDGYKKDNLRATPDFFVDVYSGYDVANLNITEEQKNIIYNGGDANQGILEIKLSGQYQKRFDLIEYHKWQVQQQLYCTGLKWAVIAFFSTETRDNRSTETFLDLEFIFPDEQMLATINEASQKALQWKNNAKAGHFKVYPDLNNKVDKKFSLILR